MSSLLQMLANALASMFPSSKLDSRNRGPEVIFSDLKLDYEAPYHGPVSPHKPTRIAASFFGLPSRIPNILVVEHSQGDQFQTLLAYMNTTMLKDVYAVGSCEDAERFLKKEPPYEKLPTPDLIVVDYVMHDCDGDELVRMVKRLSPQSRVVVLSETAPKEHVYAAKEAGACLFLVKPFDFRDFVALLESLDDVLFVFGI